MNEKNPKEAHPAALVCICQEESVAEAARKMRDAAVGCLIITDDKGKLSGIVTERDITRRAAAELIDLEKTKVSQIMTADVIYCTADTEFRKTREIMAVNHIRHLPIVEDGKVVRIYSLRDAVQQQLIEGRMAAEQIAMLSACLASTSMKEIMNTVVTEVPKLFEAERCGLYLRQQTSGDNEEFLTSRNNCICSDKAINEMMTSGKIKGSCIGTDCIPKACSDNGVSSPCVTIMLNANKIPDKGYNQNDATKGLLCICGIHAVNQTHQSILYYKTKLVKDILNMHLTNISQYQDAKNASMTDSLTQVGSRKYFEEMLENESGRLDRYDRSFSIAMADIDNFKDVNDKFGHVEGDSVLRKLAECMNSQKRTCDILARYGGDEFVFILPETTSEEAAIMIGRIQKKIRQISMVDRRLITFSCGIAHTIPNQPVISTELIKKADIALYQAKKAGKDCIKIWKDNNPVPKKVDINILYS